MLTLVKIVQPLLFQAFLFMICERLETQVSGRKIIDELILNALGVPVNIFLNNKMGVYLLWRI